MTEQSTGHVRIVAGLASVGAGAIHAAAVSAHWEHPQAATVFVVLALFQMSWGALALRGSGTTFALVGALGNGVAVLGWLLATTTGIWFVAGLDDVQQVQWADGLAAGLATLTVVTTLMWVGGTRRVRAWRAVGAAPVAAAAVLIAAVAATGMVSATSHDHSDGAHAHADATTDGPAAGGRSHSHDDSADPHDTADTTVPFDPAEPIDLGGVEGVTPEQQGSAEFLLAATIRDLPRFADVATAEAAGYHRAGDAEHWVNWSYVNDGRILDPQFPESLVYQWSPEGQKLVAAMFMLPDGATFDNVPDVGGKLTQWHVHDDICFTDDPEAPTISTFVGVGEPCPPPLVKRAGMPMLHVWIVPHPCGPFAALEGIAGGQIPPGEERLCDHVHGDPDAGRGPPGLAGPPSFELVPPRSAG